MEDIKKIAGVNLVILVVYSALCTFSGDPYVPLVFMAFGVGMHTIILFFISLYHFVRKENALGRTFLLTGALILVIGFSSCFGVAAITS